MKELTWLEILFTNKGLKTMREENNLNIPIEYISTTKKIILVAQILMVIGGFFLGYYVKGVIS